MLRNLQLQQGKQEPAGLVPHALLHGAGHTDQRQYRRGAGEKIPPIRKVKVRRPGRLVPDGGTVKVITIKQPWAWAIIFAGKDIENRSWYTKYRGPLLIHAGAAYRADALLPKGVHAPDRDDLGFGAIIGVVDLKDVVQSSRSRWFQGEYGFVLRNPRPLSRPVPCKGRLGLWTPTTAQIRLVQERLT